MTWVDLWGKIRDILVQHWHVLAAFGLGVLVGGWFF